MTSRAHRRLVMITAVGCLLGVAPLAACAQDRTDEPTFRLAQASDSKPAKAKVTKSKAKVTKTQAKAAEKVHKVAIQVSENSPKLMNQALNNANNVIAFYKKLGEKAVVEIVTFGDGLHMLRDTSPVKQRIEQAALETPEITYAACANTRARMAREESKDVNDITLLSEAKVTPSGVVRLAELQSQGYAYIRP